MPDFDVIIVGGGAAGLSAAATAAEAGHAALLIDRMGGGGELMNLGALLDVGTDESGPDLAGRLLEQAVAAGAEFAVGEVTALAPAEDGWRVTIDTGESHAARAVILAIGLGPGTLGIAEEAAFVGRGLSHCAQCDGPLYAGRPVVVAGTDRWAEHEARELVEMVGSVTLLTQGGVAPSNPGVAVLRGRITGLAGHDELNAITVQPDDGGAPLRLPARAVFVQTNRRPALDFAPVGLARDPDGRILTDAGLRTGLPNLFAAGDARAGGVRTVAAAIEDGTRAAANLPLGKPAV